MKRLLLILAFLLAFAGIADACQLSGRYLFVLTDRTVGEITFAGARWTSDLGGGLSGGVEVFRDCGLMLVLPDGGSGALVFGSSAGHYFTLRAGLFDGRLVGFGFRLTP